MEEINTFECMSDEREGMEEEGERLSGRGVEGESI